jgi:hypothetical protein
MWTQLMAAATAALFMQSLPTPIHFYQVLAPGKQQVISLPSTQHGHVLSVHVLGSGAGDIDCYLLINHRIVTKDESNADMCYLGMYVGTEEPIKLWIVNRGDYATKYQVNVDQ